jgi:hypothetical protein
MQANLPVKFGGLGIRSATLLAIPAYIASTEGAADLCTTILPNYFDLTKNSYLATYVENWKHLSNTNVLPKNNLSDQKMWDDPINKFILEKLIISSIDHQEKSRLLAVSSKYSSFWIDALPCSNLGLKLDSDSIRIAVALRLGCDICEIHTCKCGKLVYKNARHGLSCGKGSSRITRHNTINNILCRSISSAGFPATTEPLGLCRSDGKRPDGSTYVPWNKGKCLTWDVTCPDTFAKSHSKTSSTSPGLTANVSEDKKIKKYEDIMKAYLFTPIAIETMGPWGQHAIHFLEELASRLKIKTKEENARLHLFQRISIALQQCNAISIISTLPNSKLMNEH